MAVSNNNPESLFATTLYTGQGHAMLSATDNGMVWTKPGRGEVPMTEALLQMDVFKVPVDSLVDIWVLRFGHTWVNLDDIEADEFFKMAYVRLKSLGKLEVHYLTDRAKYVCRKPE